MLRNLYLTRMDEHGAIMSMWNARYSPSGDARDDCVNGFRSIALSFTTCMQNVDALDVDKRARLAALITS